MDLRRLRHTSYSLYEGASGQAAFTTTTQHWSRRTGVDGIQGARGKEAKALHRYPPSVYLLFLLPRRHTLPLPRYILCDRFHPANMDGDACVRDGSFLRSWHGRHCDLGSGEGGRGGLDERKKARLVRAVRRIASSARLSFGPSTSATQAMKSTQG